MAKTAEELNELKNEINALMEKLKDLDQKEFAQVTEGLLEQLKEMKKTDVSVNFEEDTIPVSDKDMSAGLRNY